MGFDVVYLPPIHPIGATNRKGRDNTLTPAPGDPGSPWAIGGARGRPRRDPPRARHARRLRRVPRGGRERSAWRSPSTTPSSAAPTTPGSASIPSGSSHRPDGSIRYAENPPKKYQDIYPIDFWPERRRRPRRAVDGVPRRPRALDRPRACAIFRVDNPHTKPFAFWEWVIADVHSRHPDVLFLAEAFTRPKVMHTLAALGFTQSYTYFTWRTAAWELREYGDELAARRRAPTTSGPNFWPNTPDILAGPLRDGPPSAFRLRAVLAATLSPNWGVYSGYELCENEPASDANEEYLHSEKYELQARATGTGADVDLAPFLTALNEIRARAIRRCASCARCASTARPTTSTCSCTRRRRADGTDPVLVVVNLDPHRRARGPAAPRPRRLGLRRPGPYEVRDELTGERYMWHGPSPYVRLDPADGPRGPRAALCERSLADGAGPSTPTTTAGTSAPSSTRCSSAASTTATATAPATCAGLTEKLDYLEWLGVDCLWLLPFYQSPLRDGGYDISDFFSVLPGLRRRRRRRRRSSRRPTAAASG